MIEKEKWLEHKFKESSFIMTRNGYTRQASHNVPKMRVPIIKQFLSNKSTSRTSYVKNLVRHVRATTRFSALLCSSCYRVHSTAEVHATILRVSNFINSLFCKLTEFVNFDSITHYYLWYCYFNFYFSCIIDVLV